MLVITGLCPCSLICDDCGNWIAGFVSKLGCCTVPAAELWGIWEGLKLAWDLGCHQVELDTDSLCAFHMIKNKSNGINGYNTIIQAIQYLLDRHWIVKVSHVVREANFTADWLADYAINFEFGCHRLTSPPMGIISWLNHDRISVSYKRLMPL